MWRFIEERIARRRFLLGGTAAGIGMLAAPRLATAEEAPLRTTVALDSLHLQPDTPDARLGNAAALARQSPDPAERWGFSPITKRPPLTMPNGARMAFWIGYNIEYWEPGLPATGRSGAPVPVGPDPNPSNTGWREYGHRVGVWRMMDLLDKYGMRASVLLNSDVGIHLPEIIEEGNRRNWVWLAHGKTNSRSWANMSLDEERVALAEVVDRSGRPPAGRRRGGWGQASARRTTRRTCWPRWGSPTTATGATMISPIRCA